jgi:hypothetical protein
MPAHAHLPTYDGISNSFPSHHALLAAIVLADMTTVIEREGAEVTTGERAVKPNRAV